MTDLAIIQELSNLCAGFFESKSKDQLLHKVLSTSIQATKADRGTIFLAQDKVGKKAREGEKELVSLIATGMAGQKITINSNQGIAGYVFTTGAPVIENKTSSNNMFLESIDSETNYETKQVLCVPLVTPAGTRLGVLEILNKKDGSDFTALDLQMAQVLSLYASLAIEQLQNKESLITEKDQLLKEREERLSVVEDNKLLQTNHAGLQQTFSQLPLMAESDSSIMICGESGTGKELIARYLHLNSKRAENAFVVINCAAIPENLFEAELFGVAKGAATDVAERKGKIELANGGTLFLDEIGEMPLAAQAKLLRVLQEKVVCRVGGEAEETRVDFRLLCATHRDLPDMVKTGEFREDLFFRLNVLNINLPPLRKRPKDIAAICDSIMEHFSRTRGWKKPQLSVKALESLKKYSWPGNIRELQNRLERAIILAGNRETLVEEDFDLVVPGSASRVDEAVSNVKVGNVSLKEAKDQIEKAHIERILLESEGNKTEACKVLQLSREGLRKAMIKHKIA